MVLYKNQLCYLQNSQTIYVTKGTERIATQVDINADKKSVTLLPPVGGYAYGERYTINISEDVYATSTKKLKEAATKSFVVKQAPVVEQPTKTLYSSIYNAILNVEPQVDVSQFTKDSKVAFATLQQIQAEHPEIYYVTNGGSTFWTSGRLELKYDFTKDQITATNDQISQIADNVIKNNITSNMTDFEKVKAIHDYIVLNTAYDPRLASTGTVPDESHRIDGLFLKGYAVCDGYAKSMQYLLQKIGVDVLYIEGDSRGIGHAWNKVKIDGVWYSLDATWDDPTPDRKGVISYQYFLIPDSQLAKDHTWDDAAFPDATSTKYIFMSDMNDPELYNGYYYYGSNTEDIALYKIAVDGTNKQKLGNRIRAEELEVYNDWIYFNDYSNGGYLSKIKIDGTQLKVLNTFNVENLEIKNNVLYYTNKDGTKSYEMTLQ